MNIAVGAVELLFEGHFAHVSVDEVHGQSPTLRLVGGANEERQRQVEAGDVEAALHELDRVAAVSAGDVEHFRAGPQA